MIKDSDEISMPEGFHFYKKKGIIYLYYDSKKYIPYFENDEFLGYKEKKSL